MNSKTVLRLLQITRPTLTKYVKTGVIRVTVMANNRYKKLIKSKKLLCFLPDSTQPSSAGYSLLMFVYYSTGLNSSVSSEY